MKTLQEIPNITEARPTLIYSSEELLSGTAPEGVYIVKDLPNKHARMIVVKRVKDERAPSGGRISTSENTVLCYYNDGTLNPGTPAKWAKWVCTGERVVFKVVPK